MCDSRIDSFTITILCFMSPTAKWNNSHWDNSLWIKSRETTKLLWELQAQQTGPWNRSDNYARLSSLALLWKYWPLKQSHTLQLLSGKTYTVHQTGKASTRELWFFIFSARLLILSIALSLSVLWVEDWHSVSALNFTSVGNTDCYLVR